MVKMSNRANAAAGERRQLRASPLDLEKKLKISHPVTEIYFSRLTIWEKSTTNTANRNGCFSQWSLLPLFSLILRFHPSDGCSFSIRRMVFVSFHQTKGTTTPHTHPFVPVHSPSAYRSCLSLCLRLLRVALVNASLSCSNHFVASWIPILCYVVVLTR